MTDMTTARAFPERHFPGLGRSLASFSVTPPADTLIAIPFDTAGEFDAIGLLAKTGGSGDAVVRAGLYDCDSTGLPGSLIDATGEYPIHSGYIGPRDLLLSAPIALSQPYWVVLLFGGTTVAPMGASAAIPAADMQRVFGISPSSIYSSTFTVASNNAVVAAFTYGSLPSTFPTPTLSGNSVFATVRSTA